MNFQPVTPLTAQENRHFEMASLRLIDALRKSFTGYILYSDATSDPSINNTTAFCVLERHCFAAVQIGSSNQ